VVILQRSNTKKFAKRGDEVGRGGIWMRTNAGSR
jgi:hypothetical protein